MKNLRSSYADPIVRSFGKLDVQVRTGSSVISGVPGGTFGSGCGDFTEGEEMLC
jgi:hypothetical protein